MIITVLLTISTVSLFSQQIFLVMEGCAQLMWHTLFPLGCVVSREMNTRCFCAKERFLVKPCVERGLPSLGKWINASCSSIDSSTRKLAVTSGGGRNRCLSRWSKNSWETVYKCTSIYILIYHHSSTLHSTVKSVFSTYSHYIVKCEFYYKNKRWQVIKSLFILILMMKVNSSSDWILLLCKVDEFSCLSS